MTPRSILILVVLALGLPVAMHAGQAPASDKKVAPPQIQKPAMDVSGTWSLVATFKGPSGTPAGGFQATIRLKQRAMGLDGYITLPSGKGGAFTGLLDDKKAVMFTTVSKNPDLPGVMDVADFTGTLENETAIKGYVRTVSTGPGTYTRGEGPYVATRR